MEGSKILNIYNHLFRFYYRADMVRWDYKPKIQHTIYGVYHIYCVNEWKRMVKEQICALRDSGLYNMTSVLYVSCIISKEEDVNDICDIIGRNKCKIICKTYDGSKYEFPALEFMQEKSQQEDFFVYYFHTKGISYSENDGSFYQNKNLIDREKCALSWRRMMEYFVFYKSNVAINALSNYDTYGACLFDFRKVRYFNGNFWWSKASYIKTIPKITEENKRNRYFAEAWLCQQTTASKCFNAFFCLSSLFDNDIPECIYRSNVKFEIRKVQKFIWTYYTRTLLPLIIDKIKRNLDWIR